MPRIAPLDPPYAPDVKASFDEVMRGAEPLMLFRVIAKSERAWKKLRGGSLLDRGPLSLRQREIVIDRTCALAGCEYEWGVHVKLFAAAAQFTEQQVRATVIEGASAPCWNAAEAALIRAIDALHARATLDDAEFGDLACHYDEAQILEIMMLCGQYRTIAYIARTLQIPLEVGTPRFPG
jgi:alkylhydroperoxidase family enzyme